MCKFIYNLLNVPKPRRHLGQVCLMSLHLRQQQAQRLQIPALMKQHRKKANQVQGPTCESVTVTTSMLQWGQKVRTGYSPNSTMLTRVCGALIV